MKNIRHLKEKYMYSPDGKLVFRVSKLNPILMGKTSIDAMEANAIPEQITGQVQEPVFFKSEPVVNVPEVQIPVEVAAVMPEEMVQSDVNVQTVPTYQSIEIAVPGMEVPTNEVNVAEDPTIAQSIEAELTNAGKIIEPVATVATSNVLNFPGNPIISQEATPDLTNAEQTEGFGLKTAVQFEEEEAAKRMVTEVPVADSKVPDFVAMAVNIEQARASIKAELDEILNDVKTLQKNIDPSFDELSRATALAKEAYDLRGRNNAAVMSAVSAGMASLNQNTMDQSIVR